MVQIQILRHRPQMGFALFHGALLTYPGSQPACDEVIPEWICQAKLLVIARSIIV